MTYQPQVGDRIGYTGDMANQPWDGTVIRVNHTEWGVTFDVQRDGTGTRIDGINYALSVSLVGEYTGTCSPRFSTIESREWFHGLGRKIARGA